MSSTVTRVADSDIDIISTERFHGSVLCEHQTGGAHSLVNVSLRINDQNRRETPCVQAMHRDLNGEEEIKEWEIQIILSLRTTWRRGGSFTLRPVYPKYPLKRRGLVVPTVTSFSYWESNPDYPASYK